MNERDVKSSNLRRQIEEAIDVCVPTAAGELTKGLASLTVALQRIAVATGQNGDSLTKRALDEADLSIRLSAQLLVEKLPKR